MKNLNGKFVVKVAGTLTAIALVVAALLGVVNMVTKDRIAELNFAAVRAGIDYARSKGCYYKEGGHGSV